MKRICNHLLCSDLYILPRSRTLCLYLCARSIETSISNGKNYVGLSDSKNVNHANVLFQIDMQYYVDLMLCEKLNSFKERDLGSL